MISQIKGWTIVCRKRVQQQCIVGTMDPPSIIITCRHKMVSFTSHVPNQFYTWQFTLFLPSFLYLYLPSINSLIKFLCFLSSWSLTGYFLVSHSIAMLSSSSSSIYSVLFVLLLCLHSSDAAPAKIGKGYRLVSIEETPGGGIVGLLQVKQKNQIYGSDISDLQFYVK